MKRFERREAGGGYTYNTREPGPYCPDTGQAHTTFRESEAPPACERTERSCISELGENAGMTPKAAG